MSKKVWVVVAGLIAVALVFGLNAGAQRSQSFSNLTASAVWGS